MTTIVTRAGKGSALTWTEGDNNFTNLNTAKLENVVEDTTPQLGGNLDVNGQSIVSTANGNIVIAPDGTGDVHLNTDSVRIGDNNADATIATRGTGDLILTTHEGSGTEGVIRIYDGVNGNISIVPNGSGNISLTPATGKIILGALDFPTGTGTNGQVLTTNGSSALSFTTVSAGATTLDGLTDVVITAAATNDVLVYDGTNWVDTAANTLTVSAASTATTATGATNVNISTTDGNTSDTTMYPVFVSALSTGNQLPHIDSGIVYNATTNSLSATQFVGGLDGMVGSITPNTGTFTTLSATGAVTFTPTASINISPTGITNTVTIAPGTTGGSINNMSIGGTTKAAGTFTTMTADVAVLDDIRETVAALTYAATITPNAADGSIRTITLTGNVTFSAFTSPVSGQTITLIITQDATGGRTLTSTMLFAGSSKTLSTAANAVDILTVSYIGTTYYASLAKAFA